MLAQMHDFGPGVLYIYEKMKLYNEIVQYHMEAGDHESVIAACKKFGYSVCLLLLFCYWSNQVYE